MTTQAITISNDTERKSPRKRDERTPTGKIIAPSLSDWASFSGGYYRHGPLPPAIAFRFAAPHRTSYSEFKKRLKHLFHETNTPHGGAYLDRDPQQFLSRYPLSSDVFSELNEYSKALLSKPFEYAPGLVMPALSMRVVPVGGPFRHRAMTAVISASIERAVRDAGFRYISQEEIFTNPNFPQATLRKKNPLALPIADGKFLVPDQLFGIDYAGQGTRFFVLEADRANEQVKVGDIAKSSFGRKVRGYAHARRNNTFLTVWGIASVKVLTVTTAPGRIPNIRDDVDEVAGADRAVADMFLFKAKPQFGFYWDVSDVIPDLFTDPWQRLGTPFFINRP